MLPELRGKMVDHFTFESISFQPGSGPNEFGLGLYQGCLLIGKKITGSVITLIRSLGLSTTTMVSFSDPE